MRALGRPAILALRRTSSSHKRKGCIYLLVQHLVLREVAGLVLIASVSCGTWIRGSVPVAWSGRQSLSERFMPTLGIPSTWCGKRQFIPGSLATSFGCWRVVGVSSLRRCRVRPFDNGSWGGKWHIGAVVALRPWFVCLLHTLRVWMRGGCGYFCVCIPTYCCCKVGLVCRDSGAGGLLCPSYLA